MATPPMPPMSGPMSPSFQTMPPGGMPPSGASFPSGPMAGGNPFQSQQGGMGGQMPPMGSMNMGGPMGTMGPSFQAPGSFRGAPPGSFQSMPPGSMPMMSPGMMPPGSMGPGMMPPGTMPPGMGMPGSMPMGMNQGMRPPTPQLHHGFGHGDSFVDPNGAAGAMQMMKADPKPMAMGMHMGMGLGVETGPMRGPIIGEYKPRYPAPETPTYFCLAKDALSREIKVEQRWCSTTEGFGTWGRANITNMCDVAVMNWKERMTNPWQWLFVHADGWLLNFWADDFYLAQGTDTQGSAAIRPLASIDIRQIILVNINKDASSAEGYQAPWRVCINFQNGFFPFRVRTQDEAQAWNARIMKGVVENVRIGSAKQTYMHNLHLHDEVEPHRIEKDPARLDSLRKLWHQAIEAVDRGTKAPRQLFFDLYRVYDALDNSHFEVQLPQHHPWDIQAKAPGVDHLKHDEVPEPGQGDGNLTMAEIEVMARELIEMKIEEVRQIVVSQEKVLYSSHRPVQAFHEVKLKWTIAEGKELLEHYKAQMNPADFFDRVVNFHHRTDISREGRVDVIEFMNAAPIFLLPMMELKKEGLFFHSAMESDLGSHKEEEETNDRLRKEGKTRDQEDAECNQQ